jgi:hypothetical protein
VALLDHGVEHSGVRKKIVPVEFEIDVVGGAVIFLERLGDEERVLG